MSGSSLTCRKALPLRPGDPTEHGRSRGNQTILGEIRNGNYRKVHSILQAPTRDVQRHNHSRIKTQYHECETLNQRKWVLI